MTLLLMKVEIRLKNKYYKIILRLMEKLIQLQEKELITQI